MVVIDPKEVAGISSVTAISLEDKPFLAANNCFSLHHHSPNSATTLPPCANPSQCILFSGHLQSVVRCVTTLFSSWIADVGFGLGMSSPKWSKEVYHWYASSYKNGILWCNEAKGRQRFVNDNKVSNSMKKSWVPTVQAHEALLRQSEEAWVVSPSLQTVRACRLGHGTIPTYQKLSTSSCILDSMIYQAFKGSLPRPCIRISRFSSVPSLLGI